MCMARKWPLAFGALTGFIALGASLAVLGNTPEGWRLAARLTARVGFPILLLTYAASSLGKVWHSPISRAIWRDRRWWGLGFAACHTIHLYALVTAIRLGAPPPKLLTLAGGGGGYVIMYLMVLTSNRAAMRTLGRSWKALHSLGIHWLWFVFLFSYLARLFRPGSVAEGVIGTLLALAALGLRLVAMRRVVPGAWKPART